MRAEHVVLATEGYTADIARADGARSPRSTRSIVATEPLADAVWDEIGLADAPTFADDRHLIIYGQRTATAGSSSAGAARPTTSARRIAPSYERDERVYASCGRSSSSSSRCCATSPSPTRGAASSACRATGSLGGARPHTGLALAGGYVGDGVATTDLAGRTLAEMISGDAARPGPLPWVDHRSRRWEPEPLRWLGVNAGLRAMSVADREELMTKKPSRIARAMAPFIGGH